MMDVKDKVRNFILSNFLFTEDQSELDNDASFIEKGIVDSTGIVEVIAFLEEEFAIEVLYDEMVPENLDSVERICTFVSNKKKLAAEAGNTA